MVAVAAGAVLVLSTSRSQLPERPSLPLAVIAEEGAAILGSGVPAVVEFGDYQCVGCAETERRYDMLRERWTDRAPPNRSIHYRHLPNTARHEWSEEAARYSICMEDSGAFGGFHRALFRYQDSVQRPDFVEVALAESARLSLALDVEALLGCVDGAESRERLARDVALAEALGVRGTPTFFSAAEVRIGAPALDWLEALLF